MSGMNQGCLSTAIGWLLAMLLVGLEKAIWSLRLRLHSGLRQRGSAFGAGLFLGLRPRLVCVALSALVRGGLVELWVALGVCGRPPMRQGRAHEWGTQREAPVDDCCSLNDVGKVFRLHQLLNVLRSGCQYLYLVGLFIELDLTLLVHRSQQLREIAFVRCFGP